MKNHTIYKTICKTENSLNRGEHQKDFINQRNYEESIETKVVLCAEETSDGSESNMQGFLPKVMSLGGSLTIVNCQTIVAFFRVSQY